jgi:hypothetical protein
MRPKQLATEWLDYRHRRREGRREMDLERHARGTKKGDVLGQGPHEVNADQWGGGGGFSTKPSKRLGTLDK